MTHIVASSYRIHSDRGQRSGGAHQAARYLDDRRIHIVDSPECTPFCELALEPVPFVVIAKGTASTAGAESNLPNRLRLEVFGIHEPTPRATDEPELFTDSEAPPTPRDSPGRGTFSLIAAAELPSVRWRGINRALRASTTSCHPLGDASR
jgi:hypothetical protein